MRGDINDFSQRWIFKNAKYRNLGENLYNKKKVGRLIGELALVVLNYVIWLIRNIE